MSIHYFDMNLEISARPTRAEINLDNLAFNLHSVKNFVGTRLEYMAVVKANAYGHGAVECAKRLESENVDWFGVALPQEGVQLRENAIRKRILCLGGFWSGQETALLNYGITPVIYRLDQAESFNRAAKARGTKAEIHIKLDTGMGRIGIRFDQIKEFIDRLTDFDNLHVEGLMTHLASADNLKENEFTNTQIDRFEIACRIFEDRGFSPVYKDIANSPGCVAHPRSRKNMVRLGGVLYGLGGDVLPKEIETPELKPVMSLRTKIALLKLVPAGETLGYGRTFETEKDSQIATIPIGYQDGYPRNLSNSAKVIIDGILAPVVGRISMDWTLIDVSHIAQAKVGDEVILIGNDGNIGIKAEDLAAQCETISYEITCGISDRVSRTYSG